jgi:hypothetical protein
MDRHRARGTRKEEVTPVEKTSPAHGGPLPANANANYTEERVRLSTSLGSVLIPFSACRYIV